MNTSKVINDTYQGDIYSNGDITIVYENSITDLRKTECNFIIPDFPDGGGRMTILVENVDNFFDEKKLIKTGNDWSIVQSYYDSFTKDNK